MTPDQAAKLNELYAWMQAMKLIEPKRAKYARPGTSALTQAYVDSHGDTVTAPKAYAGSVSLEIEGRVREIPFLS